jgi:hypothetical protein
VSRNLGPYLKLFDLPPGATFKQITARYYARIERLDRLGPEGPHEAEKQRLDHAFQILKRAYTSPKTPAAQVRGGKRDTGTRSAAITIGLVAMLAVAGIFVAMNYADIKVKTSNYEVGEVVRWKNSDEPYGKITQFSGEYAFPTGNPAPAYEIQLEGQLETVWVSERLVEKGMVIAASN